MQTRARATTQNQLDCAQSHINTSAHKSASEIYRYKYIRMLNEQHPKNAGTYRGHTNTHSHTAAH